MHIGRLEGEEERMDTRVGVKMEVEIKDDVQLVPAYGVSVI